MNSRWLAYSLLDQLNKNTLCFCGSFNKDKFIEFYLQKFNSKKSIENSGNDFDTFLLDDIEILITESWKYQINMIS